MSLTIEDIDSFIPYATYEVVHSGAIVSISFLGILADCFLLYFIFKAGSGQQLTNDYKILASLCLADLLTSLTLFVFSTPVLVYHGYTLGTIGCQVFATIWYICACLSFLSVILLSLNRYIVIVHQIYLDSKQTYRILIGIWTSIALSIAAFGAVPLNPGEYGLNPARIYCLNKFPASPLYLKVGLYFIIGNGFIGISIITFIYTKLCYMYFTRLRRKNNAETEKKESRLLFKSLTITFSFVVSFLPVVSKMFYEIYSGQNVSEGFDYFSNYCLAVNPLCNIIILYNFDYAIRRDIRDTLNMHLGGKEKLHGGGKGVKLGDGEVPCRDTVQMALASSVMNEEMADTIPMDTIVIQGNCN